MVYIFGYGYPKEIALACAIITQIASGSEGNKRLSSISLAHSHSAFDSTLPEFRFH